MNNQTKNNAKEALSNLRMEIASEMGYHYNMKTDKIESNAPQGTLMGQAENVLAGEQVGGQMTKSMVELAEQALVDKYNSEN
ncbi:MAG: small, acid-soluble spore protein, alpha/beta type [Peptostreptococcaceae bacterium]